ncbi:MULTISPECIES: hypothetical protein [Myxococcus]|uniref:Lipoprotein n=1 Tax=Myxococcus virescens TaxID=83456 RepID=A0A511HH74_9BACT|nr:MULTISPECIES: hypothetical protein [Myxococcus]WNZ60095.1 hypothetical protein QEG98_29350 [Myxococcus sp. MxC21-1]GEL72927.1 hypothetical protein MVI01_47110 [Myxococcus virescens]SDE06833.1 hypothetical protein SAMN04488504_10434 [Myxococcus virescens]
MRKVLWGLWVLVAFSACKKPEDASGPPAGVVGEQAPGASDGVVEAGPYTVTKEKLDAYVGYQRRMLEVYASLMKGLQNLGALVDAGTPEAMAAAREGLKVVEAKAKAEAEARREAQLSEADVNGIAEVVTAVVSQRQLGRTLQYEEELKKLEALQAKLPPEQQQGMAPQVASMRAQVEAFQTLADARRDYGDANIDVVLTREEDLIQNYQEMIRVFTGTRR